MASEALTTAVIEALGAMEEVLVMQNGRSVNERLVQIWVAVLQEAGIRAEEVRPAAARIIATEKFFPQPSVFLTLVRPPEEEDAAVELAWQRVLHCIRRWGQYASLDAADLEGDATALWAIERMGWERLCCEMDPKQRAIWRAEFARVYKLGRQEGAGLAYLPGPWERQNSNLDMTPILAGRPDWKEMPASRQPAPALPEGQKQLAAVAGANGAGKPMPAADLDIPPALRQWADR